MKKLVLFSVMMLAAIVSFAQTSTKTTKKTTKKAAVVNAAATTTTPAANVTPAANTATSIAPAATSKVAMFKWEENNFNFGQIAQGTPVTHEFKFTNTGNIPLIISSVAPACGCTVADYSKEPIAPGKSGYVKATYNAASPGTFHKSVTVNANVEGGMVVLTFEGEVVQK